MPKSEVLIFDWNLQNTEEHLNRFITQLPWEYKTHPYRGVYMMGKDYRYSRIIVKAQPFTRPVWDLMQKINQTFGLALNSCLFNYYPNGYVGIGLHSDSEKELVGNKDAVVVSVNLGVTRDFVLVDNVTKQEYVIPLVNGSILLMGAGTQRHYKHRIDPDRSIKDPRVNLTFRQFY